MTMIDTARRVLIADDDLIHRRIVRGQLVRLGYSVQEVSDGEAAWVELQRVPSQILLTDWMMPALDGPSLIARLRASGLPGYTYCVVLTAKDVHADVIAGLDAGADDYLVKPVDVRELRARVAIGARIVGLEQQLREARDTDGLTGLHNRRSAVREAEQLIEHAGRTGAPLSLVLLDIDHFKAVNDTYGHAAGDQALCHVTALCRPHRRPDAIVARWGGEELVLLLPNTSVSDAAALAEQIRATIAVTPLKLCENQLRLTISGGVAASPAGVIALDDLIQRADACLYAAKHAGRNRIKVWPLSS